MEYRRANRNDIDLFVENRIEFVTAIRTISDIQRFKNGTRCYIEEHIEKDDLVIYIALDRDKIIASCMACIFQTAPLPSCPTGKKAELLNVYTLNKYRRQGHAEKIVRMLIDTVKEYGVEKILLEYTNEGLLLYEKLGFSFLENQMQLSL